MNIILSVAALLSTTTLVSATPTYLHAMVTITGQNHNLTAKKIEFSSHLNLKADTFNIRDENTTHMTDIPASVIHFYVMNPVFREAVAPATTTPAATVSPTYLTSHTVSATETFTATRAAIPTDTPTPFDSVFSAEELVGTFVSLASAPREGATYTAVNVAFELKPDMTYNCTGCQFQYDRTFPSPCDTVHAGLPKLPLKSPVVDSPFAAIITAIGAAAAAPPSPSSAALPSMSAECLTLLGFLPCTRAYPFCHNGASLPVCRSTCDALQLFCPASVVAQYAALNPTWMSCDAATEYSQTLNSPDTPCFGLFDLSFALTQDPVCTIKTAEPPSADGAITSQVGDIVASADHGLRVRAKVHITTALVESGATTISVSQSNTLKADFELLFGVTSGIFVSSSAATSTVKAGGTALNVYFESLQVGGAGKYLGPANVQAVLTAGFATAAWEAKWGSSSSVITTKTANLTCTDCPTTLPTIHATCQPLVAEVYAGDLRMQPATLDALGTSALTMLGDPSAAASLGTSCFSYLESLSCLLYYGPCYNGVPLRLCASYCREQSVQCSAQNLALLDLQPDLKSSLDCTDPDRFVQDGSDIPCFDLYDSNWAINGECASSQPVAAPKAATTLLPAVSSPSSIHVCGTDCNSGDASSCPADPSKQLTMRTTQCVELPVSGTSCRKMTSCGTATPSATAANAFAYYKYEGTSAAGSLQFYSDSDCATAGDALALSQDSCTGAVRLVAGGVSVSTIKLTFDGALSAAEQETVKAAMLVKFADQLAKGVVIEIIFTTSASRRSTRQGKTTMTVEVGAPNNVQSSGSSVGSDLAGSIAKEMGETINTDDTFRATLTAAAGNKAPGTASVSSSDSSSGSGSALIIIIILLLLISSSAGAAVAAYFLYYKPRQPTASKKVGSAAYDEEENYAGER